MLKLFLICFFSFSLFLHTQEKSIEDAIPYPLEKFQKQEEIEEKIQNSTVQLSYYATPLQEIVEEWKTITEISIVLSPQIYLYRNDQQLRLTLSTETIKFQKALDLVTRYLDLIYYIDQDVLMIALPGSKPAEDIDKQLWYGLKNARGKYTLQRSENSTSEQMQETLDTIISLEISMQSLDKIALVLENAIQKPVLVDIRLNTFLEKEGKKEFFLSIREQKLRDILDQFCQSYSIAWIVEGNAIYFSLPEYIAPIQSSQEKRKKEEGRMNSIWETLLQSKMPLPLPEYSLPQIIEYLKKQWRIELIVEPELWQYDTKYSFKEKSLALKELLNIIAQENQAAYILGENNTIYLLKEEK